MLASAKATVAAAKITVAATSNAIKSRRAARSAKNRIRDDRDVEKKKVVLQSTWHAALIGISIHFVPIVAVIVLVVFNLGGWFIGIQLVGWSGPKVQAFDLLCLQVAAKLLELWVVASLGTVILTILRHESLMGNGLPLGLVNANANFTSISYFCSSAFWAGLKVPWSWWKRFFILGVIFLSGLLATFVGPSSALLMIPTIQTDWPAGGTSLWLVGNRSTLWPTHLDAQAVGGPNCLHPTLERLTQDHQNNSGCIWQGYSNFLQIWKDRHFHIDERIEMIDQSLPRILQVTLATDVPNIDTWALSVPAILSSYSFQMASYWWTAALTTTITKYSRLKFADRGGSVATIQSPLPVVRASCIAYISSDYGSLDFNVIEVPAFREYEPTDFNQLYRVVHPATFNSSNITTQWVDMATVNTTLNDGTSTSFIPSAMISVQVPNLGSSTAGQICLCSIDARWALGETIISGLPQRATQVNGQITNTRPADPAIQGAERGFLPIDDGSWQSISIDRLWFDTLIPQIGRMDLDPSIDYNTRGHTSLSALLQSAGFQNDTGLIQSSLQIVPGVESLLSAVVTDGLARIGLTENSPLNDTSSMAGEIIWRPDQITAQSALLEYGIATLPPSHIAPTNLTSLDWSIVVTGYAYTASGIAPSLAISVLLAYVLIALIHVGYTLVVRKTSAAWTTPEELLVLSQSSPPTARDLANTCAGIKTMCTMRKNVKIRALRAGEGAPGEERVHMSFGNWGEQEKTEYQKLEFNQPYGIIG